MYFAFKAKDKAGALDLRLQTRESHIAFLKANDAAIKAAGALVNDQGEMCGSLLIIEAEDKAAAEALLAQDPYAKAGLFETTSLEQWNWTIGKPA